MEEIKTYKLSSASDLIKSAWQMCKKRWQDLIAVSALVSLLTYLINLLDAYYLRIIDPTIEYLAQTIFVILSGLIMVLGTASIIHILSGKKQSIERVIRKVLPLTAPLFVLGMVANFIIGGAFLPLIIPGIILAIAFIFMPFAYLLEDKQWLDALLRSSDLTKGFRWAIVRKIFILFLWILFLCIPIALITNLLAIITNTVQVNSLGQIIVMTLGMPFSLAFSYALYQELNKIKPKSKFVPSQKGKNIYTFLLVWGIILFLLTTISRFAFPDKEIFDKDYFIKQFGIEEEKFEEIFSENLFEDDFSIEVNVDQEDGGDATIKIDYNKSP